MCLPHGNRNGSRTCSLVDFWRGQVKKLTAEEVADLGIGTIVGWDADGLMTHVRWQVA